MREEKGERENGKLEGSRLGESKRMLKAMCTGAFDFLFHTNRK